MKRKMPYMAPAVFDLCLEAEGMVLHTSTPVKDGDFQEVETMGQETAGGAFEYEFNHDWK